MTPDYKSKITTQVREAINRHVEQLKQDHPELLITRQWKLLWPRGFSEGNNSVPVVTSCKQGQYLVGQVEFVLPGSMELDLEAVELVLKDEPFVKEKTVSATPSPDDSLDLLNDLVGGINGFLESLSGGLPQLARSPIFEEKSPFGGSHSKPLTVHAPWESGSIKDSASIEETKRLMLRSPYLPQWYVTINSKQVADDLIHKLAEGFLHYQKKVGHSVNLEDYFRQYTAYLLKENKLHHYCGYKGKPVQLDSDDWCMETYCSKKPYHAECSQATLRFGAQPEDL
ncbi:MAG: hypothetical protein KAU50_01340 [Candidatus Marinimicrobia bacterium]|nr:hypothetical protein [Candidatus Neomarinimicrobiota bacterium]